MHRPLRALAITASLTALACHDPEGIAVEALELRGVVDVSLMPTGPEGHFSFEGKRGDDECSGTATVQSYDDAGSAQLVVDCLPPAGAWTSSLPGSASDEIVAHARRCDGGVSASCTELGLAFERGGGVPKDLARANMLYTQACASEHGQGCYHLGLVMGSGGAKSNAEIDELFVQGCDMGWTPSCGEAAQRIYNGVHDGRIPTMLRVARKGCDADEAQACLVYGVLLAYGIGTPLDMGEARRRLMQACSGGLDKACTLVETL